MLYNIAISESTEKRDEGEKERHTQREPEREWQFVRQDKKRGQKEMIAWREINYYYYFWVCEYPQ
jgi:hypothetical protein